MTIDRTRTILAPAAVLVLFVALWQSGFFNAVFALPEFAVPKPTAIVAATSEAREALSTAFMETAEAVALGWTLGNALGFLIALVLLAMPPDITRRAAVIFGSFQALPVIATAPLVAVWIDSSLWFKVTAVMIMVFPQMLVYALRGLSSVDPSAMELAKAYDCSGWQIFRFFRLPVSLGHVFTSLRYSVVLALIGVVVCEIIRTADGLGFEIHDQLQSFDAPAAWAAVVILALSGVLGYSFLLLVERALTPWAFRRD